MIISSKNLKLIKSLGFINNKTNNVFYPYISFSDNQTITQSSVNETIKQAYESIEESLIRLTPSTDYYKPTSVKLVCVDTNQGSDFVSGLNPVYTEETIRNIKFKVISPNAYFVPTDISNQESAFIKLLKDQSESEVPSTIKPSYHFYIYLEYTVSRNLIQTDLVSGSLNLVHLTCFLNNTSGDPIIPNTTQLIAVPISLEVKPESVNLQSLNSDTMIIKYLLDF